MSKLFKSEFYDSDPGEKASFGELFANFYCEHKILFFMIVFLVIAAVVLCVQSANKTDYEFYLMYCGPLYAATSDVFGNVVDSASSICSVGDAEVEVAFSPIVYVPPKLAEYYQQEGIEYNGAYNSEALQNFDYALAAGEYCVMLLDRSLYDDTKDLNVFVPLSDLGIVSDAAVDECALALSGIDLSKKEGFSSFPDDTVLVLRKMSFIQSIFINKKERNKVYEFQKECFISLVNCK
ncbi:MAG: hypothetical protein IJN63_08780 [Clostridia bacterium]|nr:hypothetical protein [Clostridia bacterium]